MSAQNSGNKSIRRYEFDWLRISAILLIFLYHSTRFFNLNDWVIKNINTYTWIEVWITFADTWIMPLFFVISGISLFFSLEKRQRFSKFYIDKFMRLMVPVIIASVTHCIMQVYLERLMHGRYPGTFFSFLPQYFDGIYQGIGKYGGNFAFMGLHLWYLLFLFIDDLICYRLLVWLKTGGSRFLSRVTDLFAIPGLIYIWFSVPIAVMYLVIPQPILSIGAGAWGFFYYIWFLIAGFIMVSSDKLQKTIKNQRMISLVLGIILSTVYLFRIFGPSFMELPEGADNLIYPLVYLLSAWSWIFAITGFAMRFLAYNQPVLNKLNEGVLPFYILHQSVIVLIGFFVMTLNIPDILKWTIVFISSFIIIITLYKTLIEKFNVLRFLFGMKVTGAIAGIAGSRTAVAAMHIFYIGLIIFAINGFSVNKSPMPLSYDPDNDIILNSKSISFMTPEGIRILEDNNTSVGKAVELISGASNRGKVNPDIYVEFKFSANAGRYYIWIRGKSDKDAMSDSIWLQADDFINTNYGILRLGNWHEITPVGQYSWAGDMDTPVTIEFKNSGDHLIRIQPRQVPCRIDQIWLSRTQSRIPDTNRVIK